MRVTTRKVVRDLRRGRAQVVAVAVTVMLGVGLFIASAGAFENLDNSYHHTYTRLHFADLEATGGNPARVAEAATRAGASDVTIRTQVDPPMLVRGTKLLGRVSGLPAARHPAVNDLEVVRGRYLSPADPTGILVETHAASTFHLVPGDSLRVFTPAGWQRLTVRGVVVSAEYLWPARSRQSVLEDPHAFAVVFARQATVRDWYGAAHAQVLAKVPGGPSGERGPAVAAAMRAAGAADVTTQAQQPSPATLQLDLDGFNEMSKAFPLLFLTAAGVAAYVLLTRRVRAERPLIGTLLAGGARRSRLVRHYLLQGVAITLLGGLGGVVLGVLGTSAVTHAYTRDLAIPDTVVHQHPLLVVTGLALGVLVGLAGAAAPAIAAARTAPAEAMRNEVVAHPPGAWSRAVSGLRGVPVSGRMALRDVVRGRRRTAATALGSVLALVLVLASLGMITTMAHALHLQYDDVERQDATVTVAPGASAAVRTDLQALPQVTAVEQSQVGPVTVTRGTASYSTALQGFRTDTVMHGFRGTDGGSMALPRSGILAGSALADHLHVGVGDTVTLTAPGGTPTRERIAGFVDEPLGTNLYTAPSTARRILGQAGSQTLLARFAPVANRTALRRTITRMNGVVAYADAHALLQSMNRYLGLFWAFVGIMVALGAALALAIIYVSMAVTVVERTNELATLRAAGVPLRRVAATLATENLLATLIGIPAGLLLGWVAADQFMGLYSNDLFTLPLSLPWWTLLLAAAGVLAAAALSQLPAVRAVRRLDIARVVRERAT
jgi:putative ABC transport system permease protein